MDEGVLAFDLPVEEAAACVGGRDVLGSHSTGYGRLTRETSPHLKALPVAETVARQRSELPGEAKSLMASFDAARGDLVSFLMNLTLRDWSRTATHDTAGIVTLADEVERHVEFDEEHVERVREAVSR